MIYLDYSANTPPDECVLKSFVENEKHFFGNANSDHTAGFAANEKINTVMGNISRLLGVQKEEIIFTSGSSESNNTAIKGTAHTMRHVGRHIITTPLEHPSVGGCLTNLAEKGYEIETVRINRDGTVDLDDLKWLLRDDTVLFTVCAADSETGTIQPIDKITEILKDFPNCRLHVDATQAIGKIPFSFEDIDTASIAPHKFYGINGSGILFKRKSLIIEPLIHGGASTTLYRSGTPTVGLICAAETALKIALGNLEKRAEYVRKCKDFLICELSKHDKVLINSSKHSLPNILNISVSGVKAIEFQKMLSENGVCVSVKSACSAKGTPSRVTAAMFGDRKRALSSWRISLSHLTTKNELEKFLKIFDMCYGELTK